MAADYFSTTFPSCCMRRLHLKLNSSDEGSAKLWLCLMALYHLQSNFLMLAPALTACCASNLNKVSRRSLMLPAAALRRHASSLMHVVVVVARGLCMELKA